MCIRAAQWQLGCTVVAVLRLLLQHLHVSKCLDRLAVDGIQVVTCVIHHALSSVRISSNCR